MSQASSIQNPSVALIVDTSSSASPFWDDTRDTADRLYSLLAGSERFKLFAIGKAAPLNANALMPSLIQPAQSCSLIAPIVEALILEEQKYSLIIVGSGEIFDLDDWVDDPRVAGWLLICTGDQSLQKKSGGVPQITPEQIQDVETLLSYVGPSSRPAADYPGQAGHQGTYEWKVDDSGYPLIKIAPLKLFVHLFPITKPQFEKFMVSDRQQRFDDKWYSERLRMNPRTSYRSLDLPVREQLLITGVSTDEAMSFGKWLGREYSLMNAEEWRTCYSWFAQQPATSTPQDIRDDLSQDARKIWQVIENECMDQCRDKDRHPNLQELSLMTQGILEWVIEQPGSHCGLGEPASSAYLRAACDPVHPLGAEPRRLKNLGFRLRTR